MKINKSYLYPVLILFISILFNSCSKKQEQTQNEPPKTDTVSSQNQTAGADTSSKKLDGLKITKKDVQRKFNEIKMSFDKKDETLGNNEIFIGDMNGDGINDALVYYVIVPKGGNITLKSGVVVYLADSVKLNQLLQYDFPYTAYVDKIKDNLIYCIRTEFRPTDPACCPSVKKPFKMKLEDNKLVLADLK